MERVSYRFSIKFFIILVCLLWVSQSTLATTVVPPTDDDMFVGARAIVRGKVLSVGSAFDEHQNIYTYITIRVKEVLKGQISERRIVIKEAGGQVGEQGSMVFGTPQFTRGEKVLLYLDTWKDGSLRVHQMFLGKFSIVQDERTGEEVAVRGEPDAHVDVLHTNSGGRITDRMELSAYLNLVHAGLAANSERSQQFEEKYYGDTPLRAQPLEYRGLNDRGAIKPNYTLINSANPRWFEPDSGQPVVFMVNPDAAPNGSGMADVTAAMIPWSTVPNCALQVVNGGEQGVCAPTFGLNTIIFNACDGRWAPGGGCAGILALGGLGWTGTTKVVNGTTFHQATAGFVSINPNALCNFADPCNVRETLTHEIGHALGLGHSQDSTATMAGIAHFDGRCASIRPDDVNGITFIYPLAGGGTGPLTVATPSLPNGTPNTAYSQQLIATGGTQPYSWSLVQGQGTLPPGLTLSAGGAITGTPTTNGTFGFTVQVTDNVAATAQKSLAITVAAGVVPLNSQFVSQTVPSSVQPSQVINVNMKFLNTGSQTWSGGSFFFASQNPPFNTNWGGNGVNLGAFVTAPGQTLDVNFTATAPPTPGTYNFQWQMYENGGIGFFGQASTNVSVQVGGSPVTVTTGSQLPGGTVGVAYTQSLSASGGTPPYSWSVVGGSLPTGVTLGSGGVISGNPQAAGTFNFTAQANDSASGSAQKAFSITIAPAPTPVTITTGSPLPGGVVGTQYSQSLSASGGTAPYTWSVVAGSGSLPTGLALSTGGVISGNPQTAGTFNFTVQANDSASGSAQKAFSITISAAPTPVTITTGSPLPGGVVGTAYSQSLSASGGTAPYTWSLVAGSGSLPNGVSLSTGGLISGNPQAAGTFNFTVRANDSASGSAQKAFSITIAAAPTPVTITTASPLPGGMVGTSYSQSLSASGGTAPYTWSLVAGSGSLPNGVSLGTGGLISGNPQTAGTFNFTVRANDSASGSAQKAFSITIAPAPTSVTITTGSPLAGGMVGTSYSQPLSASGGTAPYTWGLVAGSGSLPNGVSLSSGGVISGNPQTAGTFNFTVRANDSASGSAQKAFSITIAAAPTSVTITTGSLLVGALVGTPYFQALTASGGTPPYTWSLVAGGSFPAGLSLSSGGVISGTPQTAGAFNFAVKANDSASGFAQKAFSITVVGLKRRPSIQSLPSLAAIRSSSFDYHFGVSGGTPAFSWSITSGSLPPGMTMDSDTGMVSGVPSASGSWSFIVRVTDADGDWDQATFTIEVATAPVMIGDTKTAESEVGVPFNFQLTANGGSSPYRWVVMAGFLPSGLVLNPDTGLISGKPAESGNFTFTIRSTDAQGFAGNKSLSITIIASPLRFVTTVLESAARQSLYESDLASAGGTGPFVWSLIGGSLPPGLALDSQTGVISGTPTQNGWFPFTLSVTDQSESVNKDLDITVADLDDIPHIDSVEYKKGSRKLNMYGVGFDKKGVMLIDDLAASGKVKIKPKKVVVKSLDLAPGTHEIRIVTSGKLVSNKMSITVD